MSKKMITLIRKSKEGMNVMSVLCEDPIKWILNRESPEEYFILNSMDISDSQVLMMYEAGLISD